MRDWLGSRLLLGALGASAVLSIAGCGGSATFPAAGNDGGAGIPVALAPRHEGAAKVAMAVDEADLRQAIERHRITKKRAKSPVEFAGADLNSDGKAEALVLFSGDDWCSPTGCSLAVFTPGAHGYRLVSHIVSVKAPVAVAQSGNAGWRDLLVKTGGGATEVRTVRLQFTGGGYPVNALLQPQPAADATAEAEIIIGAGNGKPSRDAMASQLPR
jgi:hypothetical protein